MPRCPARLCLKLMWLAALLASILIGGEAFYIIVFSSLLFSLLLLYRGGHGGTAVILLSSFGTMALLIVLIDYVLGTDYMAAARRLLYTVASALLLAYMALSIGASELEALMGRNVVTQSLVFIGTLRREVLSIRETMAARGHEIRGPLSIVPLLTAFLACLLDRMEVLEDSLRARGVE